MFFLGTRLIVVKDFKVMRLHLIEGTVWTVSALKPINTVQIYLLMHVDLKFGFSLAFQVGNY